MNVVDAFIPGKTIKNKNPLRTAYQTVGKAVGHEQAATNIYTGLDLSSSAVGGAEAGLLAKNPSWLRKGSSFIKLKFRSGPIREQGVSKISTPYGDAVQEASSSANHVKDYVNNGGSLYRAGQFGRSNISDAQFWAPKHPLSKDYANKYGVDFKNVDYIIGGSLKDGEQYITRSAPGLGTNKGGAIEIVTNPNAVKLNYFHMP